MSNQEFEKQLRQGLRGEAFLESLLIERGFGVVHILGKNGAPQLVHRAGPSTAADFVAFGRGPFLPEHKTYHHAHPNEIHKALVHGVKRRLLAAYAEAELRTGFPVYLSILEIGSGEWLVDRLPRLVGFGCTGHHKHSDECQVYFDKAQFRFREDLSSRPDFQALRAGWVRHKRATDRSRDDFEEFQRNRRD